MSNAAITKLIRQRRFKIIQADAWSDPQRLPQGVANVSGLPDGCWFEWDYDQQAANGHGGWVGKAYHPSFEPVEYLELVEENGELRVVKR